MSRIVGLLRRFVALVSLTAMTGLFVCPTVACFKALDWLPRIQFVPTVAAGSVLVLVGITVSVALCGRLYCSTVCPLGILQDLFRDAVTLADAKRISVRRRTSSFRRPRPERRTRAGRSASLRIRGTG